MERYRYAILLTSTDEITTVLKSNTVEGLPAQQWHDMTVDSECAYGGYSDNATTLKNDIDNLYVDQQSDSDWWNSRTEDKVRAWHNGNEAFAACIMCSVNIELSELPSKDEVIILHWI